MSHTRWVLADRSGNDLGEIQDASNHRVELPLSKHATGGFSIRTTNPMLEDLYTGRRRMKVYHHIHQTDTEDLMFHGDLVSLEATNDQGGPTVQATFADPAHNFQKRVTGRDADGDLYTGQDKLVIVKAMIDAANTDGETGVRTAAMTCGTTATYIAGPYRLVDECIAELGDTLDGFDWHIAPIEYTSGKIGDFTAAALIQTDRPDAVFEYGPGTRANVQAFNYQRSWVDLANSVYNLPQNLLTDPVADGAGPDAASIAEHGLAQALVDTPDLSNTTLRDQVCDFHILIRKQPRNTLTFTPSVDPEETTVPLFGHDYFLGDRVPVRIAPEGVDLISGYVRVHKMVVELDNNDRTVYTPTTVPE